MAALGLLPLAALAGAGGGGAAAALVASAAPNIGGLTAASNTGSVTDQITTNNKPSLAGKGVPGSKITVTLPTGEVVQTTVDTSGNWVVTLSKPLPEGSGRASKRFSYWHGDH
jgi:phosphatidate phosphatase APP1